MQTITEWIFYEISKYYLRKLQRKILNFEQDIMLREQNSAILKMQEKEKNLTRELV